MTPDQILALEAWQFLEVCDALAEIIKAENSP